MNENILKSVITPGNYTLWIYDQIGEKDISLTSCTPFSLEVSLNPELIKENFVNCDAPPIPKSLIPGN